MSSDISDDDRPLASVNGNGHVKQANGDAAGDSSMSEDEIPLSQKSRATDATPRASTRKRKPQAVFGSETSDDDDDEEDVPLSSQAAPAKTAAIRMPGAAAATSTTNGKKKKVDADGDEDMTNADSDDDDDAPLGKKGNGKTRLNGRPPKKRHKAAPSDDDEDADNDEDDYDSPKPEKKKPRKAAPSKKTKVKVESDADDDDEPAPAKKKRAPKRVKKEENGDSSALPSTPKKRKVKEEASESPKKRGKKEDEEEEEVYRWWEQGQGDGSVKWQTLEHNGVIFPPPYEPLPKDVKMKYDGREVDLPNESEEVAGFYGAMLETDHAQDAKFNENFFQDFLDVLKDYPPRNNLKITRFELCDFRPMFIHFEAERAKKKSLTAAEKKELKKQKDELEAPYATCLLDGRKEKVGNFRVEPPGLFRGRGEHPKKGRLKWRLRPSDITINIGEGVPIPKPNIAGKWKSVQHDKTVTWLATWVENINGNHKYVFLAAGSSLKGQSDMMKFEKARELKKHVEKIRADYESDLKSKVMADRQRATAMYFIDRLALRAGNEKGEDEADTVGCCSLRCEHVTLEPPNIVFFDFLGKDSIRYYNRVEVDQQVFKNIRIFKNGKNDDDTLFDRVTTTNLNKHLQSYMKGLTAKVFRTYNASYTFQRELLLPMPEGATVQEKINFYNRANRLVAKLCNHQRSVPKTHEQSMGKLLDKVRALKYERMKLRFALWAADPKYKKKPIYADLESDLDDDWIAEHEDTSCAKEIEKAEKKFAKENEKLAEDNEKPQADTVLKERIQTIEDEFKKLKKERGTTKHELKRDRPIERLVDSIDKLEEKIKTTKLQAMDREEGKEIALGTSKINYIDPRITTVWCKLNDVPIERMFAKALIQKFPWAMEVDDDWRF